MNKFQYNSTELRKYIEERNKLIFMLMENVTKMMKSVGATQMIVDKLRRLRNSGYDTSHIFDVDLVQKMIDMFKHHCSLAQPMGNRSVDNIKIEELEMAAKIYKGITYIVDLSIDKLSTLPEIDYLSA